MFLKYGGRFFILHGSQLPWCIDCNIYRGDVCVVLEHVGIHLTRDSSAGTVHVMRRPVLIGSFAEARPLIGSFAEARPLIRCTRPLQTLQRTHHVNGRTFATSASRDFFGRNTFRSISKHTVSTQGARYHDNATPPPGPASSHRSLYLYRCMGPVTPHREVGVM